MADRSRWNLWFYGVRRLAAALLLAYRARSKSGSNLPHSKLAVFIPPTSDRKWFWFQSDFADFFSLSPNPRALIFSADQEEKHAVGLIGRIISDVLADSPKPWFGFGG
jgi:hypothetical protein